MRRILRAVFDWRTGAIVVASVLVAVLMFVVIDAARARQESLDIARVAIDRQADSASRATRRIDLLTQQIKELQGQMDEASADRSRAEEKIDALGNQVRSLGGIPVAVPTPRPTTTTTTKPPTTTTTTAAPRAQTTATSTTTTTRVIPHVATTTTIRKPTTTTTIKKGVTKP